jgi:phosphoglucan,water dikinase
VVCRLEASLTGVNLTLSSSNDIVAEDLSRNDSSTVEPPGSHNPSWSAVRTHSSQVQ